MLRTLVVEKHRQGVQCVCVWPTWISKMFQAFEGISLVRKLRVGSKKWGENSLTQGG